MAAETATRGTQGTQGTPQQAPPIPKMEAAPSGTPTARQIQRAAKAEAKAAIAEAKAAAKKAQQVARDAQTQAGQGGGSGPVIAPTPPSGSPPGELTTSTGLPPGFPMDVPPNAYALSIAGLVTIAVCVIGFPIVRVIARRFDRRTQALHSAGPDLTPQLQQLQESVDAMAIELERISEGQRYAAKLLTERAGAK